MTNKMAVVVGLTLLVAAIVAASWVVHTQSDDVAIELGTAQDSPPALPDTAAAEAKPGTGPINLGRLRGYVVYDEMKGYYYLQLKGMRLPLRTSPIEALKVRLDARGGSELEKNTALLHGIMGPRVQHTTILVNPDEEDEVMPATGDIAQYMKLASTRKFAGLAYTKPGGKLQQSVLRGSQIQKLEDATTRTPIIRLKGPKSGARETRVSVAGSGQIVVEGKTYEELYQAADLICVTLLKMLCGSPTCPDAATCATGGDCGCSRG